jgi:hypothetical protein
MTIMTKDFDLRVDVVPVSFARPILTPPRQAQAEDPPMFAYRCPHCGDVKLISEEITLWPFVVACDGAGPLKGLPVVLRLGQAIFVGPHLLRPEKVERLISVLGKAHQDDLTFGHGGRWVESRAVSGAWQPPKPKPTGGLFADLRAERRAPPKSPTPTKAKTPEPAPAA